VSQFHVIDCGSPHYGLISLAWMLFVDIYDGRGFGGHDQIFAQAEPAAQHIQSRVARHYVKAG